MLDIMRANENDENECFYFETKDGWRYKKNINLCKSYINNLRY